MHTMDLPFSFACGTFEAVIITGGLLNTNPGN